MSSELWSSGKSSELTLQRPGSIFLRIRYRISVSCYVLYYNISLFTEPRPMQ
jgi:hypothetical protein